MANIPINIIFGSANAALNFSKILAQYLGIVKSLDRKVDQLTKIHLNTAVRFLEQAQNTENLELRNDYLRQSLTPFNNALSLEEGERLIYAYLGLAISQYLLHNLQNTKNTLFELAQLPVRNSVNFKRILSEEFTRKNLIQSLTIIKGYQRAFNNLKVFSKNLKVFWIKKEALKRVKEYEKTPTPVFRDQINEYLESKKEIYHYFLSSSYSFSSELQEDYFIEELKKSLERIELQQQALKFSQNL